MKRKGELIWDTLVPWILAILFLVIAVIIIGVLSGKGSGLIDYIKNVLRFGR